MTKRKIIVLAVIVSAIGIVGVYFWRSTPAPAPASSPPNPSPIISTPHAIAPSSEYSQLSLKTRSKEEATKVYVERLRQDPLFEGKVALNFYGKVIDQNNQPVSGAIAHLQWNTINVLGGTAEGQTVSDGNGLFSLTAQHGKVLEVRVEKEGYYTVDGGQGALAFEYADPSSPNYNEPDPSNPVIFHLRKKGEGAKLFSKTVFVALDNNQPQKTVDLMRGMIQTDGVLTVQEDKTKWLPGAQPFPWTVTLSMNEGGLIETTNQFPFLAPESGYIATITMNMTNLDQKVWRGSMTKTYYFYLPSSNTYGRMTVEGSASLPVELNYSYNLTPGSRVLEPISK